MPDAVLASVFVLMLIAPCAFAVAAGRRQERELEEALAVPKRLESLVVEPVAAEEGAVAVELSGETVTQPEIVVTALVEATEAAPIEIEVEAAPESLSVAASQTRTDTFLQRRAEWAQIEALLAQADAARADAVALMALARAAAAKADAAAELAEIAAREMEDAAHLAATIREGYARDARGGGPNSPLPETHPSLDFPRSRGPRRAA
ncbi:hypothetical protein [Granulicella sibirica]|uniref:Uncharacterized protein n=1 Tax=Granulicella sibirica TaxID=2479048 RepID=A0A4Q0SZJ2_9BACT|nr:hypothetical protein [Granulicella sibirica]RXH55058.1 hypothetical protein GRAN_4162 [Granulicella sibirica]